MKKGSQSNDKFKCTIWCVLFLDSPKFDCKDMQIEKMYASNVEISCIVRADPPVDDVKITFYDNTDNSGKSSQEFLKPLIISGVKILML